MADDQKPKTMDINDLVRELSKSSTNPATPTPPLAPASQAPRPSFPTLPIQPKQSLVAESRTLDSSSKSNTDLGRIGANPPMRPPMAGSPTFPLVPKPFVPVTPPPTGGFAPANPPSLKPEMPRPQFNIPPKSAPLPSPTAPLPTPGVKEYQSSIRTMNEDISKLKQGQKPAGIDVPRKVEQVAPVPQSLPPKPAMPSQQFKVPSVNLGEAQKTGPLARSKDFSKPGLTAPSSVPVMPKAEPKSQIYVPEEGQKGGNRNVLFMGIGAVAIVAGFAYWFFILRLPAPEVVIESPTPTPVATPVAKSISQLFPSSVQITITSTEDFSVALNDKIKSLTPIGNDFLLLEIFDENGNKYTLTDYVARINVPVPLDSLYPGDSALLVYGQKEAFDDKGSLNLLPTPKIKIVLIAKSISSNSTRSSLDTWEMTMTNGLSTLFGIDPKKALAPSFLDNTYNGTNIRYRNFAYADSSIDYSILDLPEFVSSYLILTNSREAMYATIDKLKGF